MNDPTVNGELLLDIFKIFIALLCGGIIGFERELKDKPAGLRTNILVATGSCLFVIFGIKVAGIYSDDPGRIMGPIITGIGFLGAGTIIRARGSVRGLTSAATIWVVAGVGMSAGLGLFYLALAISILVLFILLILPRAEAYISEYGVKYSEFVVISKPNAAIVHWIRRLMEISGLGCSRYQVTREKGMFKINFVARGKENDLINLLAKLLRNSDIKEAVMEET
ncbi:MAG: MgtC/SapB family protein [Thermoplasmata archaeon]|nr:MAG: MgtC/SapB family protein [Thermoplasmata archaeon]